MDGILDEIDYDRDGDTLVDNYPLDPSMEYDLSVLLKPSCTDDSDEDGCAYLFDHYPDYPNRDTDASIYDGLANIPTCEERMNDCDGKNILLP